MQSNRATLLLKRLSNILSLRIRLQSEELFMTSVLIVHIGNYLYNLFLGRLLGPELFADTAVLITFLLVLSFLAMTFQLVAAKFSVEFEANIYKAFKSKIYKYAVIFGVSLSSFIVFFSEKLRVLLNTSSSLMFIIFGIGIPIYFLLGVNRGFFQGKGKLKELSITYQAEMLSRLVFTIGFILLVNTQSTLIVASGILISFVFGIVPSPLNGILKHNGFVLEKKHSKRVINFFVITAFYELTQIVINNSDVLLVKHYFKSYEAGLYASLALIGRVVYFLAWMFVMLLLPKVIQLKKEGHETSSILFKYVRDLGIITLIIIISCIIFPEIVVLILFGEEYLSISALLWKYALATGLFAISNIFVYYHLSLEKYIPIVISGIFGIGQIALIIAFHKSLNQVVEVQIYTMILLLFFQIAYFFMHNKRTK